MNRQDYEKLRQDWHWNIPEFFNAARDVCDRNVAQGLGQELAITFVDADDRVRHVNKHTLKELTDQASSYLLQSGIRQGDRVIINLSASFEYVLYFLGCMKAGMVAVPLSPQLTPGEVSSISSEVAAALVLTDAHAGEIVRQKSVTTPVSRTRAEDPAYIVYTSGTTAKPKGVIHSHRSLLGRDPAALYWMDIKTGDKVFHASQLNWTFTLGTGLLDPLRHGASVILHAGKYDPGRLWRLAAREKASILVGVPTVYRHWSRLDENHTPWPELRHAITAGDRLSENVSDQFYARTGLRIYEGMGMSEVSYFISNVPGLKIKAGSCGLVQPGRECALFDDAGNMCFSNAVGRLAVAKSDRAMMLGYWGEKPLKDSEGEYFFTGDRASCDEEGYFILHGRDDDIIKSFGYRISPYESENLFKSHPHVVDCATVGVVKDADHTLIVSYVVRNEGSDLSPQELLAFAAGRLAAYKLPHEIVFVDELPRTANGKIMRKLLREPESRQKPSRL